MWYERIQYTTLEAEHFDGRLRSRKVDLIATATAHSGRTALQAAAKGGQLEIVERLVKRSLMLILLLLVMMLRQPYE